MNKINNHFAHLYFLVAKEHLLTDNVKNVHGKVMQRIYQEYRQPPLLPQAEESSFGFAEADISTVVIA